MDEFEDIEVADLDECCEECTYWDSVNADIAREREIDMRMHDKEI